VIRLARLGKKKRPFYRLVVVDSRKARDGQYIANLGYYNPFVEPFVTNLHDDEIVAWMKKGANVSATARSLLKGQGLIYRFALEKQGLPAEDVQRRLEEWRAGASVRVEAKTAATARKRTAKAAAKAAAKAKPAEAAEAAEGAPAPAEAGGEAPAGES
jgi:small subunit ribosomal protein S16